MFKDISRNYYRDGSYSENQSQMCTGFDPKRVYLLGEKYSGLKPRGVLQKYELLKVYHLQRDTLFEDPQFQPNKILMGDKWSELTEQIEWHRPKDIVANPMFILDGEDKFDINQGELGDCWFLAAIADVTQNKKLVELIVPPNQSFEKEYAGIFHFRFWQYGRWIDVVVDDRLPTHKGKLIFVRSKDPNIFWTALLEKAYAKLYGSYKNIEGGFVSEALEDLTGGLNEIYVELLERSERFNFFDMILMSFMKKSFMGCGILDSIEIEGARKDGLYSRHAYGLTDVAEVKCKVGNVYKLLRIRNPWGKCEWNGDWSDDSETWNLLPEETKDELLERKNDGEFWMRFEDFVKTYTFLEFCHPNPDYFKKAEEQIAHWKCFMIDGAWTAGINNGGLPNNLRFSKNPQYLLQLNGPEKNKNYRILIGLMQKNRRVHNLLELPIGFAIYRVANFSESPILGDDFFTNRKPLYVRSVETNKQVTGHIDLSNGTYCIIPVTENANSNCEFLLRVYAEIDFNVQENDEPVTLLPGAHIMRDTVDSACADDAIKEVFRSFAPNSTEIGWIELKNILDQLSKREKQEFSKEVCRSMVALADSDMSGKLNFQEFYQLWEQIGIWRGIFRHNDSNRSSTISPSELRAALRMANVQVSNRILKLLIMRYSNENGEMEMEDFLHCCVKLNLMIVLYNSKKQNGITLEDWLIDTLYS